MSLRIVSPLSMRRLSMRHLNFSKLRFLSTKVEYGEFQVLRSHFRISWGSPDPPVRELSPLSHRRLYLSLPKISTQPFLCQIHPHTLNFQNHNQQLTITIIISSATKESWYMSWDADGGGSDREEALEYLHDDGETSNDGSDLL